MGVAKNATLREERFYLTKVILWPVEIVWLTKITLNHMNKGYNLPWWGIVIMSTHVGDFWDKLQGLLKLNVVIIAVKICMMIKGFNFEIIASINHGN